MIDCKDDDIASLRAENERLRRALSRLTKIPPEDVALFVSDLTEDKATLQRYKEAVEVAKAALGDLVNHYDGLTPSVPMWIKAKRATTTLTALSEGQGGKG